MSLVDVELFDRINIQDPSLESRWVGAYRIECSACSETATIPANTGSGTLPPAMLKKKFTQLGWSVGGKRRRHLCPCCAKTGRKAPIQPDTPSRRRISISRLSAEAAFAKLKSPIEEPRSAAATLAEARALCQIAHEACRQIDTRIEDAILEADAMKRDLLTQVETMQRRLLL